MQQKLTLLAAAARVIVYAILSIVIISRLQKDAADGETFLIFIVAVASVFELAGTILSKGNKDHGVWCNVFAFLLVASIEIAIISGATFAIKFDDGVFQERKAFQPIAYTVSAIALVIGLGSMGLTLAGWLE